MCGISCLLNADYCTDNIEVMKANLKRRGPDHYNELVTKLDTRWIGYFCASVLHTQGEKLACQPIQTSKSIFLWNGDIFDGPLLDKNVDISDTTVIVKWLETNEGDVPQLVKLLQGPYAFIYYDNERNRLWISRDVLGRHSLLWDINDTRVFVTSVGHKDIDTLTEVPAAGVFCLHFEENLVTSVTLFPWSHWKEITWQLPSNVQISENTINYFNLKSKLNEMEKQNFFVTNVNSQNSVDIMNHLLENSEVNSCANKLLDLLTKSVEKRVTIQRNICQNCFENQCSKEHAKIGVLFSGGLDSTIVAYLANKFVPDDEPIDLLNVAFNRNGSFDVPDRKTGESSLNELHQLCPNRTWNFVKININQEELQEKRQNHICHLIHPLKTILDESLGCALWFACRGEGFIDGQPYKSPSKIILLGTGADEQLGGYTRHRNLLKRNTWQDLGQQLIKETIEISKRNLGRDDRVASDHGRQPRFPFLDEFLISFIANLPPWQKCDPLAFPPGVGDKLILRLVAVKLGLSQCATFPKRAFQFGCRIAKSKEKGDGCSDRL